MKQMPKIDISPDFTIEDIRKIRRAKTEFLKTLSPEEQKEFHKNEGMEAYREIQRIRAAHLAETEQKKHTA